MRTNTKRAAPAKKTSTATPAPIAASAKARGGDAQADEAPAAPAPFAPAAPLAVLAAENGIPGSTLSAIRAKSRGPRTFLLGRRVYCLRGDWAEWMRHLAETGGVSIYGKGAAVQGEGPLS